MKEQTTKLSYSNDTVFWQRIFRVLYCTVFILALLTICIDYVLVWSCAGVLLVSASITTLKMFAAEAHERFQLLLSVCLIPLKILITALVVYWAFHAGITALLSLMVGYVTALVILLCMSLRAWDRLSS